MYIVSHNNNKMNYTNKILKYAIAEYFAEQGKRMCNLAKAKKDSLIKIIEKYNIDVNKYAIVFKQEEKEEKDEAKKQAKIDEEEQKQREIKYQERMQKERDNRDKVKKHLEDKNISLTHLQKRRINLLNLKQEVYFKDNADNIKEGKERRIKDATAMGNNVYGFNNFTVAISRFGGLEIIPNKICGRIKSFHFDTMRICNHQLDKVEIGEWVNRYHDNYEIKLYNLYRKSIVKKMRRKILIIKH